MNAAGDTVIPPCPLVGHNWGGATCQLGMPWAMQSTFNPSRSVPMQMDDGTRILRLSYHVEDMFRIVGGVGESDEKIRCVPCCFESYRAFVTSNLQAVDLRVR